MWSERILALLFFGIGMKTDLFQSCGHCLVLQICWHIEFSTWTASSFRIWNSSAGILSPLLALFTVRLPKAHLTSHSRMSGSRWVTTSSCLSESLRHFWYSSSVYSCHLFLISSASVRYLLFLSFIMVILSWNVPLIAPIFLKRFLSLSRSIVFLYFCASFLSLLVHLCIQLGGYMFPFFYCFLLLFSPQLFIKPPHTTTLPSCMSFCLGWFGSLPPIQHIIPSTVFQALSLWNLIPWIYSSPPV